MMYWPSGRRLRVVDYVSGWPEGFQPHPTERDTWLLRREMGCTERELLYWLPAALEPYPYTVEGSRVDIAVGQGSVTMTFAGLEPRRIALITIARLQLDMAFSGLAQTEALQFLHRWDLYTRRGGG